VITVRYLGHSCFYLVSDKRSTIVVDPYGSSLGYHFPPIDADICLLTHEHRDHNAAWRVGGNPRILKRTCEFRLEHEVTLERTKETFTFVGLPTLHDKMAGRKEGPNTVYTWYMGDIKFCHLGDLGVLPDEKLLFRIGLPDVLFVPVGGKTTLDPLEARLTINMIKPKLVFPMHYLTPLTQVNHLCKYTLDDFLSESENVEKLNSLAVSIDKNKLPENSKIWVLNYE